LGLAAIGTCSAGNMPAVERFDALAVDYRAGDFVVAVRRLTAERRGGAGVDAAFDAMGGEHFARSFACLAAGGMLVGFGSQTMAVGGEGLLAAGLGLVRLKVWGALGRVFGGRRAAWYSITEQRLRQPEAFKADMASLFGMLRDGAIHPVVIDRLPLSAARAVHARIDAGGLGGKIVLLPWGSV
jgi:NADPH:quinone reductase-like Zn-dependent oxidoreductase